MEQYYIYWQSTILVQTKIMFLSCLEPQHLDMLFTQKTRQIKLKKKLNADRNNIMLCGFSFIGEPQCKRLKVATNNYLSVKNMTMATFYLRKKSSNRIARNFLCMHLWIFKNQNNKTTSTFVYRSGQQGYERN